MPKYLVTENCYGLNNSYWEKEQVVDIDHKGKLPRFFQLLGKEAPAIKGEETKESVGNNSAEIERNELIIEAKGHGIKEADILTVEELQGVLVPGTTRQKIVYIITQAKKRMAALK